MGFGRKDFKLDSSSFPVTANQPGTQRLWTFSPFLRKTLCLWAGHLTFSCGALCLNSSWQVWMSLPTQTWRRVSLTNRALTPRKSHYRRKWTVAVKWQNPTCAEKTCLLCKVPTHHRCHQPEAFYSFPFINVTHIFVSVRFWFSRNILHSTKNTQKLQSCLRCMHERSNWCDFFLSLKCRWYRRWLEAILWKMTSEELFHYVTRKCNEFSSNTMLLLQRHSDMGAATLLYHHSLVRFRQKYCLVWVSSTVLLQLVSSCVIVPTFTM